MFSFLKNKNGSAEVLTFLASGVLLIVIVFNILPPLLTLFDYFKLLNVHRDTFYRMELAGGMTPDLRNDTLDKLESKGFDTDKITITAADADDFNYGEEIDLTIEYDFDYKQYKIINLMTIDIISENTTMKASGNTISLYYEK